MIDEEIKKLLDSSSEDDNMIGWELIKAKKVPYEDVVDYVENSKIATRFEQRWIWDGKKFTKNIFLQNVNLGLSGQAMTSTGWPSWSVPTAVTTSGSGTITFASNSTYPRYFKFGNDLLDWKEEYKKERDAEIQKEKELDKPKGLWANIKHAFK